MIDFTKNIKQEEFYNTAIGAIYGQNSYRNLSYGGAIRGGKSYVCAAIKLTAAKYFPNSRWHIFRSDFPALQGTTIPTFEKIIGRSSGWAWNRDRANFFLYHKKSDGKIFFKGENISQDPMLNDLLGMETNGIWLEQIEELSMTLWNMAQSRNGSWYIDPMPKPIQLNTFNPTQTFIKELIYEPWKRGDLKLPYFFQQAFPKDNAYVTEEQYAGWGNMADRYKRQFIEGDWTNFLDTDNLWAFAFDRSKHLGECEPVKKYPLYLSFDFNRNPICCSIIQWYNNEVRILETVKLANSDIYKLCDYITVNYPNYFYVVTGDATGQNSSALVQDNINFYTVIKQKLQLANNQLKVPTINPRLEDNQVLFNSILTHYKIIVHKDKAKHFIYDCENVRTSPEGKIDKDNRQDPTKQADALDTVRYWFNVFMWNFLKSVK